MKEKNRKKRIKYYVATAFFMLCSILQIYLLGAAVLHNQGWGRIIKELIWLVISIVVTLGSYLSAKDIGTSEDDDERDQFIQRKTEQQMFKVADTLLLVLGTGLLIWALVLNNQTGMTPQVAIIMAVAIAFLLLWNLLIIVELILSFINYRHS